MSGVFGRIDAESGSALEAMIARAGRSMVHHERYQVDTWVDPSGRAALGRIGIEIFNREAQPVLSADGRAAAVLAGELYNQAELRRELERRGQPGEPSGDLELILRLYRLLGSSFIQLLDGAFVLAIWDGERQALVLANDRFGLYPTYYTHERGAFSFAPEMKALMDAPGSRRALDWTAFAEYMRFQFLLGDKTFFEGIKLLPNATVADYSARDDRLEIHTYWDFSRLPNTPASITFEEALEESTRLFRNGMERLSQGDYRLGVFLSGGLDSRAILGMIPKERRPVDTFTYGLKDAVDVHYAQRIARAAGSRHHTMLWKDGTWVKDYAWQHLEMTEGFHSWIHAHGISCLDEIRQSIDLNLTGLGGDYTVLSWNDPALLNAGDDVTFLQRMFDDLNQRTTWPSADEAEEGLMYVPRMRQELAGRSFESLREELKAFEHMPYLRRAEYFALVNPDRRMFQYYTIFKRSAIELRFPFYDYRYQEFMYSLPPALRMDRKLRKAMIVRRMPELAEVRNAHRRDPLEDRPLAYLSEHAMRWARRNIRYFASIFPAYRDLYADYETWLRGELHDWGESILLGEKIRQRDLFDPDYLRSIWARMSLGVEPNIIGKLAPIMTYEMLLERFYNSPNETGMTPVHVDKETDINAEN